MGQKGVRELEKHRATQRESTCSESYCSWGQGHRGKRLGVAESGSFKERPCPAQRGGACQSVLVLQDTMSWFWKLQNNNNKSRRLVPTAARTKAVTAGTRPGQRQTAHAPAPPALQSLTTKGKQALQCPQSTWRGGVDSFIILTAA